VERFERLGCRTIGELARADRALLERRLGSLGTHAWRLAQGDDPRLVVSDRGARSVSSEQTLSADVVGQAAIAPILRREVDTIARRLRAADLVAGGLRVKLRTSDFRIHTRQAPVTPASNSAADLWRAAEALCREFDLSRPVRLVGAGAFDLADAGAPTQAGLFDREERAKARRLDRAVDQALDQYGRGAVQRGSEVPEVKEDKGKGQPE